jgi:pyruvate ferredoxin oxidoreductase gamma subunit
MDDIIEIRWHGRGGQGCKTASIMMAKIASATGKYIQAFPEYGPERMGAPVLAYTRISDKEIHLHCQIEDPDVVVVLDPTLIDIVDITENLILNGQIIINSELDPPGIREKMNLRGDIRVYTIDADRISEDEIGRILPNTPMLGVLNRVTKIVDKKLFMSKAREEFEKKFARKPEVIDGNIRSLERAYQEVKGL